VKGGFTGRVLKTQFPFLATRDRPSTSAGSTSGVPRFQLGYQCLRSARFASEINLGELRIAAGLALSCTHFASPITGVSWATPGVGWPPMGLSIPCGPPNMPWRCSGGYWRLALPAVASTAFPTALPTSPPKLANSAYLEHEQRMAGYLALSETDCLCVHCPQNTFLLVALFMNARVSIQSGVPIS
jgi:hypothetical protein